MGPSLYSQQPTLRRRNPKFQRPGTELLLMTVVPPAIDFEDKEWFAPEVTRVNDFCQGTDTMADAVFQLRYPATKHPWICAGGKQTLSLTNTHVLL